MLEPLVRVFIRNQAIAPTLIGKWRIGYNIVESLQGAVFYLFWIGQSVALFYFRCGIVMQDHVHMRQAAGGGVLFLAV